MNDIGKRYYRTRVTFLAFVLTVAGLALILLDAWIVSAHRWTFLHAWPLKDIGLALFTTGLIAVAFTYIDGNDKDERDSQRISRAVEAQAPAIVRAVLDSLVASPQSVDLLATEQQDQLIRNGLAARLGDGEFAAEVYDDIRDQAIRAAERWQDLRVDIRLSPLGIPSGSINGAPAATPPATNLYAVTVRCEYKVVPKHRVRNFVCVSDRAEYRELTAEPGATSAWYLKPKVGVDPATREAFELVQFTIDGVEQPVRRSSRKGGQSYSVRIAPAETNDAEVTVAYTYRTVTSADGHLLYFDIEQPTHGTSIQLDYTETNIRTLSVVDFIASSHEARLIQSPADVPGKSVRVEFDDWAFPRSGVAFIWLS